ncbi:hypothetical protein [Flavobacterium sp. NKUCC04_CG]|uniref:hypothetical protein n=1 Tax=Flavobacterium sp. NKUCC04_CG TaxID=2842121 RepID=UPI001C5BED2A|nr:hypothetical protein [Flavobacterium sp. NKUCC04_CG]MBW3518480.1 hypothetical protein [Flavobacterium sp. NKUCC04_CG]
MRKRNDLSYSLTGFLLLLSGLSSAQVSGGGNSGVGTLTPDSSAVLDLVSANTGVLIPRIANIETAISNPANGLLVYDTVRKCLSQNIGSPSAPDWVCISGNVVKFFYMPSVALDITNASGRYNLFEMYKAQFSLPKSASPGAPSTIPFFNDASDLYYYVTDYSANVFSNVSINEMGVLTYNVLPSAQANSDSSDFMNVVLVVK